MRTGLVVVVAALSFAACPRDIAREHTDGEVTLTAADDALTIAHGGGELVVDLTSVGVRSAEATWEMQFGMFDVRDLPDGDFARPSTTALAAGAPAFVYALDDGDAPLARATVRPEPDGHVVVTVTPVDEAKNRVTISLSCAVDEHFAGFGAQSADVDHRGQRVPLFVSEQGIGKQDTDELPLVWQLVGRRHTTHVPSPTWVSNKGVAFVLDTSAYSIVDVCASDEDKVTIEVWEPSLRLHVFVGADPLDALAKMSAFVGRPRVPPPWAFAPWNDAIKGEQIVRDFADFLRANEIPSSAIWSEDWRGGEQRGDLYRLEEDWRLDRAVYPTYEDMTSTLRAQGFMHQVYFNTFLTESADIFEETAGSGLAVNDVAGGPILFDGADADFSPTGKLDLTNDDAVAYVKQHLHTALDLGARGWMADYAEWMPIERAALASGEDPELVHNRYPVLWAEVNDAVVQESGLADEVCVYHRSGHLYSQRHVQIMWAGDQRTSFQDDDGFPTVIRIGLGLAASGFPFLAHDIAGYQSSTNPPSTKELFFRWTALGALTPVMRTHHGTHAALNWALDKDDETIAHYKRWAVIHTRLYPYWRSLALSAVQDGRMPWNAPGLVFPDDEAQWATRDQLMVGEYILVAPVVVEGDTSRDVVVPSGRFVTFAPDAEERLPSEIVVVGPTTISVSAAVTEQPMLLRAGGIVPMLAEPVMTLLPGIAGMTNLDDTEGDRLVIVALGAPGSITEESGARYVLEGDGTTLTGTLAEGDVVVTGDGVVEGDDFTFTLEGHPSGRATRVRLR